MAQLKASEKRLLLIFGGMIFLMANYLAYQWITEGRSALEIERTRLETEKFSFEGMLGEREQWGAVREWVDRELPVYRTIDDRDTYLISLVRNRAQEAGVEIVAGPNSRDPEIADHFEQTLVNVAVQGEIGPIVRWLHSLQAPDQFRAVTSLIMKPAKKESSELRCEITLEQWWSLESQVIAMGDEAFGGGTAVPASPAGTANPGGGGESDLGTSEGEVPAESDGAVDEAATAAETGEVPADFPDAATEPEREPDSMVQSENDQEDS